MAANIEQGRFLGIRWRDAWAAICRPWMQISTWSWVQMLTPPAVVQLLLPDGSRSAWSVEFSGAMVERKAPLVRSTGYLALALPESLVLSRCIVLPALLPAEMERAIELDAAANNPFPPDDLCWSYAIDKSMRRDGSVLATVVIASRRQIRQHIHNMEKMFDSVKAAPEIWVSLGSGVSAYIVMPGFGEILRMTRQRMGRALSFAALVCIFGLTALIAVTPTLQLRARAIEAVNAYTILHEQAGAGVVSREALVRAADKIRWVDGMVRDSLNSAEIINILTRALGDDTSLTVLNIRGRKVLIEGQTANAAELMQALGRQPGFSDVVAPAAATRPFGSNKDLFKIEFTLDAVQATARKDKGIATGEAASAVTPSPGLQQEHK